MITSRLRSVCNSGEVSARLDRLALEALAERLKEGHERSVGLLEYLRSGFSQERRELVERLEEHAGKLGEALAPALLAPPPPPTPPPPLPPAPAPPPPAPAPPPPPPLRPPRVGGT